MTIITVHSEGQVKQQLDFYLDRNPRGAGQFQWKIRGNVSAARYQAIVRAVEEENQRRGRNDVVINPREAPYEPFRTIRIRSVRELESAVQREGRTFICQIVPQDWNAHQAIAFKANQLGVEVDSWTQ